MVEGGGLGGWGGWGGGGEGEFTFCYQDSVLLQEPPQLVPEQHSPRGRREREGERKSMRVLAYRI